VRRWRAFSADTARYGLLAAGGVLGVATLMFGRRGAGASVWLPDVVVGVVVVVAGGFVVGRRRTVGVLLLLTGCGWFVDTLTVWFEFLHRGPLVHLLLVLPARRRLDRFRWYAVGVGYVAAALWPLWADPGVAAGLAVMIGAVGLRTSPRIATRADRWAAAVAVMLFGGVVLSGAIVLTFGGSQLRTPMVHAYELVVVAIVVIVFGSTVGRPMAAVSDLVVDLGETRSTALRDAFADALGDPTLQLGHWTPSTANTSGGATSPRMARRC
jgi:hypothetical protein